jgi:uncharacterized protein YqjF (DUF2071 family)
METRRTWPPPRMPWVLAQVWSDLLFAHWRVPYDALRRLVPEALELERHDGDAWIAVVPFDMELRPRALPGIPGMAHFPELNVRTYVSVGGRPGVYFFSLDAASLPAVLGARAFFRLPYRHASMSIERRDGRLLYQCRRRDGAAVFRGRYGPLGAPAFAARGSLDEWLTERYCLYTMAFGVPWRLEIDHAPWSLQPAVATLDENTMTAPLGLPLSGPPLLHFSARQEVVTWPPYPCR